MDNSSVTIEDAILNAAINFERKLKPITKAALVEAVSKGEGEHIRDHAYSAFRRLLGDDYFHPRALFFGDNAVEYALSERAYAHTGQPLPFWKGN